MAYLDIDRYIIGLVGALDIVALFHVPAKLVGLSRSFLAAPGLALQTEVSRYYEERREDQLPAYLQLFLRVQMAFTLWLAGALFLLARPVILLMSTASYLEALPLLLLLLLVLPVTSLAAPMEAAFRGLQGLKVILIGNMIWALVYFGSLPWMLGQLGMLGLGLAQLCGSVLQAAWVLGAAGRRGWLRGLGARLPGNLLWSSLPLAPALILPLLLPGRQGLSPSPAGIVLGLAVLAAGAWLLLAGGRLFDEREKRWLTAKLPGKTLQRAARLLLRLGEGQP
jgi:O-antigen/teichoic acid export membrane protein